MLQRLAQLRVALLDLSEQPDVFDRNHRLSGKSFKQCDLLVGERTDFLAANIECADRVTLAQQRRPKLCELPWLTPRV